MKMKKKSKGKNKNIKEVAKTTVKKVGNIARYDVIHHEKRDVSLSIVLNITNRKLIQYKKKYSKNMNKGIKKSNENLIYTDIIFSTKNCIKNILEQTYLDYEIIVVIDNMENNIYSQISEYMQEILKTNNNITYIKLNKRANTKLIGNMYANGKYITFIDNYNYVSNKLYNNMLKKTEEYSYDIIVSDINLVDKNNKLLRTISSNIDSNIQNIEIEYKNILLAKMYTNFNNKVIKKEIIDKIMDNQDISKESIDIFLNFKLMKLINSIAVVKRNSINILYDEIIYEYSYYTSILKGISQINEYAKTEKMYEKDPDIVEYLILKYIIYLFLDSVAKTRNRAIYIKAVKESIILVRKLAPKFYQKKNNIYINNLKSIEKYRYIGILNMTSITAKIIYLLNYSIKYGRYFN